MTYRRALVAAACALALTGCAPAVAVARPSRAPGRSLAATASPPAVTAAQRCGAPENASTLINVISGDAALSAYEVGSGARGVVLVPELGARVLCGWWSYAAYLASNGFRVLIFDHQCTGRSACHDSRAPNLLMDDIAAAAATLRRDGARRIALVGASQGGSEVIIAGTHPPAGVVGLVALSADELTDALATLPYPATAATAAARLALPCLFAVAEGDQYASVVDTRAMVASVPARAKSLIVLPAGRGHGWDLLAADADGGRPAPNAQVLAFLEANLS